MNLSQDLMNGFGVFFSPNPAPPGPIRGYGRPGVVAVARHDAESVHALLVQNVHRVDDRAESVAFLPVGAYC